MKCTPSRVHYNICKFKFFVVNKPYGKKPVIKQPEYFTDHWRTICLLNSERLREGWPPLSVETEANGDSWSTYGRCHSFCSLVGSLGSLCPYKRFRTCLGCLVSPVQNIIFLTERFFTLLVPIAQQPGQAVVFGRLSLCLFHWTSTSILTKVLMIK